MLDQIDLDKLNKLWLDKRFDYQEKLSIILSNQDHYLRVKTLIDMNESELKYIAMIIGTAIVSAIVIEAFRKVWRDGIID